MIWLHFWFLKAPASTMYKFSHSVYRVVKLGSDSIAFPCSSIIGNKSWPCWSV